MVWDVKRVSIQIGDEEDDDSWIYVEVFNDKEVSMDFVNIPFVGLDENKRTLEGISCDAMKRLRDFLNYVL